MNLLPFIVFALLASVVGIALMSISSLLGAKRKKEREHDIYESGVNPVGSATRRYDIKFYLTAILFLLFDVEIVFLFPWALSYKDSPYKGLLLAEFIFFMFILLVGYMFVIFSKSLDWEE